MASKRAEGSNRAARRPTAKTPEGRELQLQSLAFDLAEKRLEEGTASSAEIVYLLKSANIREKLELERIRNQNALDEARVQQILSQQGQEELLERAMAAFTVYQGRDELGNEDYFPE